MPSRRTRIVRKARRVQKSRKVRKTRKTRKVRKTLRGGSQELFDAARDGDLARVKALATPENVNYTGERSETALNVASWEGHVDVVKFLLTIPGIDVNKANDVNETPLYGAVFSDHIEVAKLLIARPDVDVNVLSANEGATALCMAALVDSAELVQLLLERPDIDVNKHARKDGSATPLYTAALNGYIDCVELLLDRPETDVNMPTGSGEASDETPLYGAASQGHVGIVQLLRTDPRMVVDKKARDAAIASTFNKQVTRIILTPRNSDPAEGNLNVPANSTNSIYYAPIQNGNILLNFNDESKFGRYYSPEAFNALKGTNPITRKPIKMTTVKKYRAKVNAGAAGAANGSLE